MERRTGCDQQSGISRQRRSKLQAFESSPKGVGDFDLVQQNFVRGRVNQVSHPPPPVNESTIRSN
ncbi:hypothetical protein RISK_001235 [Rhodopirellula islandica]|uniref:Uncharacterized protein n=1 Tax=Rhodopirellula islandica TaxID=595434 RepID=A0A0J1BJD1_RHOIS|nr:hypothetical protein RISK_001235 [Rhodopirellula islandica]